MTDLDQVPGGVGVKDGRTGNEYRGGGTGGRRTLRNSCHRSRVPIREQQWNREKEGTKEVRDKFTRKESPRSHWWGRFLP